MSEPEADDQRHAEARDSATSVQRLQALSVDPALRIVIAANPAAPATLLERLATDQSEQVREAVAGNPNTPWRAVQDLAWEFPHAFLQNPIGSLQVVAYPEQINTDAAFWGMVLQEASIPAVWWNWLRSHPVLGACGTVRLHVQFLGETTHLYGSPREGTEQDLLTLMDLLAAASSQAAHLPYFTDHRLTRHNGERIIGEWLQWLAQSANEEVRGKVAKNPQTPGAILQVLAADLHPKVRGKVAENVQISPEALQALAADVHPKVRRAVAENPQTPGAILQTLAQDTDGKVRRAVASHLRTPAEVLQTLAMDEDAMVRAQVAGHPQTPVEILQVLARDSSEMVRAQVAGHPQTPVEILQRLADDWVKAVRAQVAKNPQAPVELLPKLARERTWSEVRSAVAENLRTPVEVLQRLACDTDSEVRLAVALNRQTPGATLQTLAQDTNAGIQWVTNLVLRLVVETGDPLCEQGWREKLRRFLRDEANRRYWYWIRSGVIRNMSLQMQLAAFTTPDLPAQVCRAIINVLAQGWTARVIQSAFSGSEYLDAKSLRPIMAPFLPPIALQKLALSSRWEVRYLVALHPRTPWETRQHLCQDGNRYVRAMAKATVQMRHEAVHSGKQSSEAI